MAQYQPILIGIHVFRMFEIFQTIKIKKKKMWKEENVIDFILTWKNVFI